VDPQMQAYVFVVKEVKEHETRQPLLEAIFGVKNSI